MDKDPKKRPAKPVPSASIMLIRDGHLRSDDKGRLEVLMIKRHGKIRFAGGALVFPGGKVDRGDSDTALFRRYERLNFLPHRFAGIRELFEEAGILLARRRTARRMIDGKQQIILSKRYRERFLKDHFTLRQLSQSAALRYYPEHLVPFAHWVTPDWQPMRFSTVFFLAPLPLGQTARHDGGEAIDSFWVRPSDLLKKLGDRPRNLMFPTRLNLARLARAGNVRQALDQARKSNIITVMPRVVRPKAGTAAGATAYIPVEAGYGGSEFPF